MAQNVAMVLVYYRLWFWCTRHQSDILILTLTQVQNVDV